MCLSILPDQCSTGKWLQYFQGLWRASCQLCTATHNELKDQQLILQGFPINRHISDAIEMFGELENIESFFSLPSNDRVDLTHEHRLLHYTLINGIRTVRYMDNSGRTIRYGRFGMYALISCSDVPM